MELKEHRQLYLTYTAIYLVAVAAFYYGISFFDTGPASVRLLRAAVSAIGVSFAFFLLVDKMLWRLSFVRLVAGIRTPILSGRWEGSLYSSFNNHKTKFPIVLEFSQTLTKLKIRYYDKNAITHSRMAGFSMAEPDGSVVVICVYYNHPVVTDKASLLPHSGVMELYFDDAATKARGIYYNNPHQRSTFGHMQIALVSRKRLGRF